MSFTLSRAVISISKLLRGPYKPSQYAQIILPLTLLRRLECVLESGNSTNTTIKNLSSWSFSSLSAEFTQVEDNLKAYLEGWSTEVKEILDHFQFTTEVPHLARSQILPLILSKFSQLDLHPEYISNVEMGVLFEQLIYEFNQQAPSTTGDYFTPPEVSQLMVQLLFQPGNVPASPTLFDPTCGSGGLLSSAAQWIQVQHPEITAQCFGQDFNPQAYAIAATDALIKGESTRIRFGDSLIDDQFQGNQFDYFLSNPPFGVDWKRQQPQILAEAKLGTDGRFAAGLPRVSDGSLLFLQHIVSKFKPTGSRAAVIFSGSPLFTGGAGSGESNIRQWIIEQDWLETIVALGDQLFYNTSIPTYLWILDNQKSETRQGKIQLIDARNRTHSLRRSQGEKRRFLDADDISQILLDYQDFTESDTSKIMLNQSFGYFAVPIHRPLRLAFQMTPEREATFIQQFPHHQNAVTAISAQMQSNLYLDWNQVQLKIRQIVPDWLRWKTSERKTFRSIFTQIDETAKPVQINFTSTSGQPDLQNSQTEPIITQLSLLDPAPLPLSNEAGELPQYEPDFNLKDYETVPLTQSVQDYFQTEVRPHVPDAWINFEGIKVGYEINVNRHFYRYVPPRPLDEITADILKLETEISGLLQTIVDN